MMNRICRSRLLCLLLFCLGAAGWCGKDPDVSIELVLENALWQPGRKPGGAETPSLLLDLQRTAGVWQGVWGVAGNFNTGIHRGVVVEDELNGDRLTLKLKMNIMGDVWVPGGLATYEVDLTRRDGDRFAGGFHGEFRGAAYSGRARALVVPARLPGGGFKPVRPGEHPRLLFRKEDLPRLREKARTSFGKAALGAAKSAAVLALNYQVTGSRAFAEQAMAAARQIMTDRGKGSKMVRSRVYGWRAEQLALAFDMCYDAWPPAFKEEVKQYLYWTGNRVFFQRTELHREIGWDYTSTYPGQILYGSALAGLALWGEPGDPPAKPAAPMLSLDLPPLTTRAQAKNLPVEPFEAGKLPRHWLVTEGVPRQDVADPFAALGGIAGALPEPGTKVKIGDRKVAFQAMPAEYLKADRTGIALGRLLPSQSAWTICFATALKVTKPETVKVNNPRGRNAWAQFVLAGRELQHQQVVRLQKGLYPLIIVLRLDRRWETLQSRLDPAGREDLAKAEAKLAEVRRRYELELALWETAMKQHQALNGAGAEGMQLFEISRMLMRILLREGVGRGGCQKEISPIALENPARYALAYRNLFGVSVTGQDDVASYVPYKMFRQLYPVSGKPVMKAQDIAGQPDFAVVNCYHESRDMATSFLAALYPLITPEYQPAALWFWNRVGGVKGANGPWRGLLDSKARPYDFSLFPSLPVYAFVNYPPGGNALPPGAVLPRTWVSPGPGYVGFRNGFKDENDAIVEFMARSEDTGRNNAGTFRITAFGQAWTHSWRPSSRERFTENVVQLPGQEINESGRGRITHLVTNRDGSGAVTIDLAEVYGFAAKADPMEKYGNVMTRGRVTPTSKSGLRAAAVDFSGTSGAPVLVAIADVVCGAGKRAWTWQVEAGKGPTEKGQRLPKGQRKFTRFRWRGKDYPPKQRKLLTEFEAIEDDPQVKLLTDGFVIRKGDALLRATITSDKPITLRYGRKLEWYTGAKASVLSNLSKAIFAESDGDFFVVITIGIGEPPTVMRKGMGPKAIFSVGSQIIRFDGRAVHIEKR